MRYKHFTFLGILCAFWGMSCSENKQTASNKEFDFIKNTTTEYDSIRQIICYKEALKYDLKGEIFTQIKLDKPNEIIFACIPSFFNYGEDIRLFNGFIDDVFFSHLGTITGGFVLNNQVYINITEKKHNKKYGEWGYANIANGNSYVNNVFVTPLAMKAYNNKDYSSLVFIQLCKSNKYMNVIFYGEPNICLIISMNPNLIVTNSGYSPSLDSVKGSPGRFWYDLN